MTTPSILLDPKPSIELPSIPKRRARRVAREVLATEVPGKSTTENNTGADNATSTQSPTILPELSALQSPDKQEVTSLTTEQIQSTRLRPPQAEQSITSEPITDSKALLSLSAPKAHDIRKKSSSNINTYPAHSSSSTRSFRKGIRVQARPIQELRWGDSEWPQDRPRTAWRRVQKEEELKQKAGTQEVSGHGDDQASPQLQRGQKWVVSPGESPVKPSRREVRRRPFGSPRTDLQSTPYQTPHPPNPPALLESKTNQYSPSISTNPVISGNTDILVQAFQEFHGAITAEQANQNALLNKISDSVTSLQQKLNQRVSWRQPLNAEWKEDSDSWGWGAGPHSSKPVKSGRGQTQAWSNSPPVKSAEGSWIMEGSEVPEQASKLIKATGDDWGDWGAPNSKPVEDTWGTTPSMVNPVGDLVLNALHDLRNEFLEEKAYQRKLLSELTEKRNTVENKNTDKTKLTDATEGEVLTVLRDLRQYFLDEKMYPRKVLGDPQTSQAANQPPIRRPRSLDNIHTPQVEGVSHWILESKIRQYLESGPYTSTISHPISDPRMVQTVRSDDDRPSAEHSEDSISLPATVTPFDIRDADHERELLWKEAESRLHDVTVTMQNVEDRHKAEFSQHEDRDHIFPARERADSISQNLSTRLPSLNSPAPTPGSGSPIGNDDGLVYSVAQQAASQHTSDMDTTKAESGQFVKEKQEAAQESDRLLAEVEAKSVQATEDRDARIKGLEEELAAVRAELENEKQQRITIGEEALKEESKRLLEWDEAIRKRGMRNDLRDIVKKIQHDLALDREGAEESQILNEPTLGIEKVVLSWINIYFKIENVQSTAQEQVPFNVQRYLGGFIKALTTEVRMLLDEVGILREECRALRHEFGYLLITKSNFGPGGEFNPEWKPSVFGNPPPNLPPSPPPMPMPEIPFAKPAWRTVYLKPQLEKRSDGSMPMPEILPVKPGWRTVHRRRLKRKRPVPQFFHAPPMPQTPSWQIWTPPSEISIETKLAVPSRETLDLFVEQPGYWVKRANFIKLDR